MTAPGKRENVPLSGLTTFRIGGPCGCLYVPADIERAIELLRGLDGAAVVLGGGSNILAADAGVRTPLLHTAMVNHIVFDGETVRAGCGAGLPELSRAAAKRGLSGLEWASGIPGSLGGAVVMNAGAYGGEMSGVVTEALVFDGRDAVVIDKFDFSYRHSIFHDNPAYVILEATLRLTRDDPAEIAARIEGFRKARNEKQPVNLPSAGSFFKHPPGHYAAALIDQCGLKGVSAGGARVSEKHAGFIVNTGGATCDDVLRLAALVHETVRKQTGAELEPEVRLLGDIHWAF
ncbi:MAG: UDP-N-acetylmuramate dehydrogenase [Oscillospiraceae bacterium]|jgi:UDP-N-acetylmuramate dehydrogenase|nr:UDP-N-acetylmuramate dehydrogenase [Oscillospiraceae bacterium]